MEEGDTAPESDSVVSEVLGEAQKQIDMSATPESAEKTDSLFEERQSEDTLADPISAESEERTEAAITEDTPDEEVETWTSDAITEIIPSDNAALDDQPEAEKEETESSDVVIEPIPSNEAVSDDQNPEENLANDEKGEAALSNQENSTEESQDASDDSVQVVPSEKEDEEEELLEEEVLFGGEYAERASEEMKAEETLIEEALPDDSVVVELNAADNSDSEREPKPVSFTPRVALMGEGQTRSFTLSADSYNPEGAELGEVTKVTVEGGEEAAFSDIEFTEAGTYGFAIMDDAQEEYPWELTVVVDENNDSEQLYIDSTRTVYSRGSDTVSANNHNAEFKNKLLYMTKNSDEELDEPAKAVISFKKHIHLPEFVKEFSGKYYLPYLQSSSNGWKFYIRLQSINDAPMPSDTVGDYKEESCLINFNYTGIDSDLADFGEILYTSIGNYKYQVYEYVTENSVSYFDYDTERHSVEVEVFENEQGQLEAKVKYEDPNLDFIIINNNYNCSNITFKKTCIGDIEEGKEFDFNIKLSSDRYNSFIVNYIIYYLKFDSNGGFVGGGTFRKETQNPLKLKENESITIVGLPKDVKYSIKEIDNGIYKITYDGNQEGITSAGQQITTEVLNEKQILDTISFSAKVSIDSYGYVLPDKDNTKRTNIPWNDLKFSLQLTGENNAPMPAEGLSMEGNSITKVVSISARENESALCNFGDIVFENEGEYEYTLIQTNTNDYPFIEYDKRVYKYIITAQRDETTGKMVLSVECKQNDNLLAEFENEYIGTNLRITKAVSGKGASSTYSFPITIKLTQKVADEERPLVGWRFSSCQGVVKSQNETEIKDTKQIYKTDSQGIATVRLTHRDFIWLYGIPNGVHFAVVEPQQTHYYAEYTMYYSSEGSENSTDRHSGTVKLDKGNLYVYIKNKYSSIPLTGHEDPLLRTYMLFGCLFLVITCAYARRKLR